MYGFTSSIPQQRTGVDPIPGPAIPATIYTGTFHLQARPVLADVDEHGQLASGVLLPGYAHISGPSSGDLPLAEHAHASTLKLPVWHRAADRHLADAYTEAITKVARHHKDLTP